MAGPGEEEAGRYRGTAALGVPLPHWPWELVLIALDVWDGCFTLRGTSAFDPDHPFRSPSSWSVSTDRGTVHAPRGGGMHGSTPTRWHVDFVASLPDDATEVRVFTGTPVEETWNDAPLPDEATAVVPLANWPRTAPLAEATVNALTRRRLHPRLEASLPRLLVDRAVRPDRVIPVSTQLDDAAGGDLCILSVETWPSSFDLHVAGTSWWGGFGLSDSSSIWTNDQHRRWFAQDDRGGHYRGELHGGNSGLTSTVDVSFVPALDPQAGALTLEFPSPFDHGSIVRCTVELSAV